MAEKGIKIADQDGGESVACRDAVNQDNDSNDRIVQLVDQAARPGNYDMSAIRHVSVSDSLNMSSLPAVITDNLLDVSDASSFVFYGTIEYPSSGTLTVNEEVVITPIIVSDSGLYFEGPLSPVQMVPLCPTKASTPALLECINEGSRFISTQLVCMPTYGAKYIGFHVTMSGDATEIRLMARVSSLAGKIQKLDEDVASGVWGGTDFPVRA